MRLSQKCYGCSGTGQIRLHVEESYPLFIFCKWCNGTGNIDYFTGDFLKEERKEFQQREYERKKNNE